VPADRAPEGLIGRDEEWQGARATLARTAEGVGSVLLVAGEAGIGKTALAEELFRTCREEGWRVAWATAIYGASLPGLWPWRRILTALNAGGADVGIEPGDPVAARVEMFDVVADRLAQASHVAPVLVVMDDAHWADPASVAMLLHVAATVRQSRVCVAVTYRPEDAGAGSVLGEVLPALRRTARELRLGSLAIDEVAALAARVVNHADLPEETRRRLAFVTGGNPLFVAELVRLLPPGWTGDADSLPAPPSVIDLVRQRLVGLGERASETLKTAAAIGTEVDVATLARALGATINVVAADVDEATRLAITHEVTDGRFAFRHPLFRAALYDALGTTGRAAAHARVASALEAMRGEGLRVEMAALAHHFVRSAPLGNAEPAVRYAIEAAQEAIASGAYETASLRFAQALAMLDLAPSAANRVELVLAQADADAAASRRVQALALYERAGAMAAEAGDLAAAVQAALGRSGGAGMEVVADETAMAMVDRALTMLGDGAPALRARLLARSSVALALSGVTERRASLVTEALGLARGSGSEVAQADVDVAWCHLHAGPAHVTERIERASRVVRVGELTGEVRLELLGRRLHVEALFEVGRFDEADDAIVHYSTRAQLVREAAYTFFAPLWRATLAAARGDDRRYQLERAELEAVIADEPSAGNARLLADVQEIFHRLDHEHDAAGALEVFAGISADAHAGLDPQIAITNALLLAAMGSTDEARQLVERSAAAIRTLPKDAEWVPALMQLLEVATLTSSEGVLSWAADQLAPAAETWAVEGIGAAIRGPVARGLALAAQALGDYHAAATHADQADRLADRCGVARWSAHAARPVSRATDAPPSQASLQREPDGWSVEFSGRRGYVRHSKGMADIARLLACPGVEVSALDLASQGLGTIVSTEAVAPIDDIARTAYQRRLAELDAELDAADVASDARRSAALAAEKEMLAAEPKRPRQLGGRARRTGSSGERARTAVTTRVRDALKRLDAAHPAAAAHLRRSIRTGTFCVYEPVAAVVWEVTSDAD
jgi:tetratricopeptide (TPR) repeat protein